MFSCRCRFDSCFGGGEDDVGGTHVPLAASPAELRNRKSQYWQTHGFSKCSIMLKLLPPEAAPGGGLSVNMASRGFALTAEAGGTGVLHGRVIFLADRFHPPRVVRCQLGSSIRIERVVWGLEPSTHRRQCLPQAWAGAALDGPGRPLAFSPCGSGPGCTCWLAAVGCSGTHLTWTRVLPALCTKGGAKEHPAPASDAPS